MPAKFLLSIHLVVTSIKHELLQLIQGGRNKSFSNRALNSLVVHLSVSIRSLHEILLLCPHAH